MFWPQLGLVGCVGSIAEDGSPRCKANSQGCSCRVTPGGGGQRSLRSSSSTGSQSRQATPGGAGGQGDRTLGRGCERHFLRVGSSTCLGPFHHPNNPPGRLLMPCPPDPGSQTLCDGGHSHLDEPFSPSACPRGLLIVPHPLGTALSWQQQLQSSPPLSGRHLSAGMCTQTCVQVSSCFLPHIEPGDAGLPPTIRCLKLISTDKYSRSKLVYLRGKQDSGSSQDLRPHRTNAPSYFLQ